MQYKGNYCQDGKPAKGVAFILSLGNTLTLGKQALVKDLGELLSIVRNVAAN